MNPSGSIKDRMINYIFKKDIYGKLSYGCTIIEASSGNTGSSLAMLSSYYGFKTVICTNSKCSQEKLNTN